eukprot:jgi/Mesvir1/28326/Mv18077-RA.1
MPSPFNDSTKTTLENLEQDILRCEALLAKDRFALAQIRNERTLPVDAGTPPQSVPSPEMSKPATAVPPPSTGEISPRNQGNRRLSEDRRKELMARMEAERQLRRYLARREVAPGAPSADASLGNASNAAAAPPSLMVRTSMPAAAPSSSNKPAGGGTSQPGARDASGSNNHASQGGRAGREGSNGNNNAGPSGGGSSTMSAQAQAQTYKPASTSSPSHRVQELLEQRRAQQEQQQRRQPQPPPLQAFVPPPIPQPPLMASQGNQSRGGADAGVLLSPPSTPGGPGWAHVELSVDADVSSRDPATWQQQPPPQGNHPSQMAASGQHPPERQQREAAGQAQASGRPVGSSAQPPPSSMSSMGGASSDGPSAVARLAFGAEIGHVGAGSAPMVADGSNNNAVNTTTNNANYSSQHRAGAGPPGQNSNSGSHGQHSGGSSGGSHGHQVHGHGQHHGAGGGNYASGRGIDDEVASLASAVSLGDSEQSGVSSSYYSAAGQVGAWGYEQQQRAAQQQQRAQLVAAVAAVRERPWEAAALLEEEGDYNEQEGAVEVSSRPGGGIRHVATGRGRADGGSAGDTGGGDERPRGGNDGGGEGWGDRQGQSHLGDAGRQERGRPRSATPVRGDSRAETRGRPATAGVGRPERSRSVTRERPNAESPAPARRSKSTERARPMSAPRERPQPGSRDLASSTPRAVTTPKAFHFATAGVKNRHSKEEVAKKLEGEREKECTFNPRIHEHPSTKIAKPLTVEERIEQLAAPRQDLAQKLAEKKNELLQKEMQECSFKPKTGRGPNLQFVPPVQQRLMVDTSQRMVMWEKAKRQNDDKLLEECSFTPRINETSASMVDRATYRPIHERSGEIQRQKQEKLMQVRKEVEGSNQDLTFQPQLNERSRRIAQERGAQSPFHSLSLVDRLSMNLSSASLDSRSTRQLFSHLARPL